MTKRSTGWGNGLLGVLIFSGSLPATRVAVAGFSPLFLTAARAAIAALLGAAMLAALSRTRPSRGDVVPLLVVAAGVVVGFPLLTALALREVSSAHSIVFIGVLPLVTAMFAAWRGGERPRRAFWIFSTLGATAIAAFALARGGRGTARGDILMAAAVVVCALGYAEGGRLARRLGGWQVISWALVLAVPLMLPLAIATRPATWAGIGAGAWAGLAYVSIFSMLVGFVFWYRGLALGGVANVGQLQLLQPIFGLALAGLLLHEPVDTSMLVTAAAVVVCVACARRFA